MKPRCKIIVDGITIDEIETVTVTRQSHRYPDSAIVTIDNTKSRWNNVFNDHVRNKIDIYFRYEDVPKLTNWVLAFSGYTDTAHTVGNAEGGAKYLLNASSLSSLLENDTWSHKWEGAHLKTIVYDIVHTWFPIDFRSKNYYIGDFLIEDTSRWGSICDLAELFGCICYITDQGVLYFGPYTDNQKYVYQYLNNYPRKFDEQNANIHEYDITHRKAGLQYSKIVVVKKDPDGEELYKGEAESTIPRITNRDKTYTLDHKYIQSDAMAKELADWILWKYEREYITISLTSYGVPFIRQEHVIEIVDLVGYSGFYWVQQVKLHMADDFRIEVTACSKDPEGKGQHD
jgi:hypothetical protein